MPQQRYSSNTGFRPGLHIEKRSFPKTHIKPQSNFGMSGSWNDIRKMAISGLKSATLGLPGNHPYASMAFLTKLVGDTPADPDIKAKTLGYKDAADQRLKIANAQNHKGQLTVR